MSSIRHRRWIVPIAAAATLGLTMTACTGDIAAEDAADVDCSEYEEYGSFDGEEVSIYGTIVEVEAERLEASWADFETCTGIDVTYQGTQEFEAQVRVLVDGDNAPDLGIFPQPGLFATFADDLVAPPAEVEANVDEFWTEDWKGFGTVDGTFLGAPLMASVKGFVWYSPSMFEENGWEPAETLDDLMTLTEDIAASGVVDKPWCAGFSSGEATGWPGTDWVEDMVLRLHGPDVYDQWTSHEIPFNDPKIVEAFDAAGEILKNEDYVNGGYGDVRSINDITFNEGGWTILDGTCALHHQASFYEGLWPEGTTIAEDGDIWAFITPGQEAGAADVTGGGEIVGAFTESEAVGAFQTYLSSPLWANNRLAEGGVISANSGVDPENLSSDLLREAYSILSDENTTFRFDGSDIMPGAVGSDSFWKGIVSWISGTDTQTVVDQIEASWPQ